MTQKVLKVGSSAAVTIPKKSLKDLGLKIGDQITAKVDRKRKTMLIQRAIAFTPDDERILQRGKDFIERYRKDLEVLARG